MNKATSSRSNEPLPKKGGNSWVWVGALFLVTAFAISSCTKDPGTVTATNLPEDTKKVTPVTVENVTKKENITTPLLESCGNATCRIDQVCMKQKCQCRPPLKSCAGSCIPQAQCCSDRDCQATEVCSGGQCQFSCDRVICQSNQICDPAQKRCTCPGGYRYCQVQNKCIPQANCCDKFDCDRGQVCIPTTYSAKVCLTAKNPVCKYLGDHTTKVLSLPDNRSFDVTSVEFLYGGKLKIAVDGSTFIMTNNARESLNGSVTVSVDDIRELGGGCRAARRLENI